MIIDENAVAIVTGGGSGLGEATARALAAKGARVAILDRNADAGSAVATDIGGLFVAADVTSDESVDAAFAKAREAHGQERVLVNCAGIGDAAKTASRSREGDIRHFPIVMFERVLAVNLIGTLRCVAKSAAGMLTLDPVEGTTERGAIVMTASVAAEDGQVGQAAYSASKAGIVGMTLPIARDLSTEGIRINTILPGIFDTPLMQSVTDSFKATLSAAVPFPKRLGDPAEYAAMALAMIENGYWNGEDVRLDGAIRMAPR